MPQNKVPEKSNDALMLSQFFQYHVPSIVFISFVWRSLRKFIRSVAQEILFYIFYWQQI
jgi:hypothetical protein